MKKKGRGLSYDEKKDRILKIFHDTVKFPSFRRMFLIIKKYKSYLLKLGFLFLRSKSYLVV